MPGERSDRDLLAAHVGGQADAFDELVRRYGDRLWRLALRTLDHREDAADAVQEALISAFRSAAGYRGECEVSTWLHRITINACRDRLRRRRVRAAESLAPWHDRPAPRNVIDEQLTRMTVAAALDTLPTGQRLAVVLVEMQGFSIAEAAELLEVREGTVKSRCNRARLRLAQALRHLDPEDGGTRRNPDRSPVAPLAPDRSPVAPLAREDPPHVPPDDARSARGGRRPDRGGEGVR